MSGAVTGAQFNLYATDPDALAAFYRGLGLKERFRFPATGPADQVEFDVAGMTLGLTRKDALDRLAGLRVQPGPSQGELVLWCDDVDALYAAAQALGATPLAAPRVFNQRIRAAWLADTEGHRVKLVALLAQSGA